MNASDLFTRVETYIRENPGALFIIFSQVLLVTCAFLLVGEATVVAEELAVYAYVTLILGVTLQLFTYLLHSTE